MRAIILAAGTGSRMGDICAGKPKCLMDIGGQTLLEVQIDTLHASGVDEMVVVRGYKGDQIDIPGVRYYENPDYSETNVLQSLLCARDALHGDVLILYSDILFEQQVVDRICESKHDVVLAVMVNWQDAVRQRSSLALRDMEMVCFDAENQVRRIGKNVDASAEPQGQFAGMVKCSPLGAEYLKRNAERAKKCYEGRRFGEAASFDQAWLSDLLQEMACVGVPLHATVIKRGWLEIDTPEDYDRALSDHEFVRRLVSVKTDWAARAKMYDRLVWVSRDELLETMVCVSDVKKGDMVLDVGTGTGKVLMALKRQSPGAEFHGVDICPEMIEKIDPGLGFDLDVGEIESLDAYGDAVFDVVTARMVLHHVRDTAAAMAEVHRVLKPGGRVVVCEGIPPDRHTLQFYEEMFRFKEDRNAFLLDDLVNLLLAQGLHDVTAQIVVLKNMSLKNWLANAALPFRNIDIITRMHRECDEPVKKAYNMREEGDDLLMDWKFAIVSGAKR